jgi:hypothetical protein
MRPDSAEPQVIPPNRSVAPSFDDETLSMLASLLDDLFRVPGTAIRFGLDPLIGLVPGIGDLITSAASFLIILSAWQRQLPRVTVARMVANVAIDTAVGAIPFIGDAFDVAWKSNRKNLSLLQRGSMNTIRRQDWRDWLFLLGVIVVMLVLAALPITLLWFVIHTLRHH